MFSETLLGHFRNDRRVGRLDPPAVTVQVENPVCGDILALSALVEGGVLADVRFRARGCTASIAAGSALAEMLLGMSVARLGSVDGAAVEAALDGLPSTSKHAARLAGDAAKALAAAVQRNTGGR